MARSVDEGEIEGKVVNVPPRVGRGVVALEVR